MQDLIGKQFKYNSPRGLSNWTGKIKDTMTKYHMVNWYKNEPKKTYVPKVVVISSIGIEYDIEEIIIIE